MNKTSKKKKENSRDKNDRNNMNYKRERKIIDRTRIKQK